MPGKSDPLNQNPERRPAATMWLEPESMERARDAFFNRFMELFAPSGTPITWRKWESIQHPDGAEGEGELTVTQVAMSTDEARVHWYIAWAAAVAAFSYLSEGRTSP